MAFSDLRSFLTHLESIPGQILHITDPLATKYEVAAALGYQRKPGPAVISDSPIGYPGWQVVGNLLGTKKRMALALEVSEDQVESEYLDRLKNSLPPVEATEAPVKEVKCTGDIDLVKQLPVLTYSEKDAGPYISSGIVITRDKTSGRYHLGIHRIQVKGPNRLGILLANPPVSTYFREAEARGEAMEIAIAIGVDPMFLIGSVVVQGPGPDKLSIAGGLRKQPIPMVSAESLSFPVPANAEVIIEGRVLPGIREPEGPFGEATGYYFAFNCPVIEVTAITHRASPIYHAILPFGLETETITGLIAGSDINRRLSEMVEGFVDFDFMPGTYCFTGVLSLKKKTKAQSRRAGMLALNLDPRLKQVIVVDDDVNIRSNEDVAWAMATRCRPDEDVLVLSGMPSYVIDPASKEGTSGKFIVDATKPVGEEARFERIRAEAAAQNKAEKIWANLD